MIEGSKFVYVITGVRKKKDKVSYHAHKERYLQATGMFDYKKQPMEYKQHAVDMHGVFLPPSAIKKVL